MDSEEMFPYRPRYFPFDSFFGLILTLKRNMSFFFALFFPDPTCQTCRAGNHKKHLTQSKGLGYEPINRPKQILEKKL